MTTPSEIFDDFQAKLADSIRRRLAAQVAAANPATALPPGELFDPESDPRVSAVFDAASGMFLPKGAAPPFPNWRAIGTPARLAPMITQCLSIAGAVPVGHPGGQYREVVYDNYGNFILATRDNANILQPGVYVVRKRSPYRTNAIDAFPRAIEHYISDMRPENRCIDITWLAYGPTPKPVKDETLPPIKVESLDAAIALMIGVVKLDKMCPSDIRQVEKMWSRVVDAFVAIIVPFEQVIDTAENTIMIAAAPAALAGSDVDLAAQVRVEARVTVAQLTRQNAELAAHASRLAAELVCCHDRETALRGETAAAEKRGDERLAELRSRFDALRCDLDESRRRCDNLTRLDVARAAVLDESAVAAEQLELAREQVATLTQRNRELLDAVTRETVAGRNAAAISAKTHEALAADLKKADMAADVERVRAGRAERERDEARVTVAALNAQLVARLSDSPPAYGDAVAASYAEQLADAEKRAAAAEKRCAAMAETVAARDAALKRAVAAAATLTAALK